MVASHLDQIVFINGEFIPGRDARISIFDRGLLFADAVYEGLGVLEGNIIDFDMHMVRLERSLGELEISMPMPPDSIRSVFDRLIRDNGLNEGFLYLQVTRGEADRDYTYQSKLKPNVFAFTQPSNYFSQMQGVKMISHEDLRWKRRDIKSTNLLGQVMAKNAADRAGAYEALLVDEKGNVTEGGASSFFIVKEGVILCRPVTYEILHGITRQAMLRAAMAVEMKIEERIFTLSDAMNADEAFITGSSSFIQPVIEIDGKPVGDGSPGPVTSKVREMYFELLRS